MTSKEIHPLGSMSMIARLKNAMLNLLCSLMLNYPSTSYMTLNVHQIAIQCSCILVCLTKGMKASHRTLFARQGYKMSRCLQDGSICLNSHLSASSLKRKRAKVDGRGVGAGAARYKSKKDDSLSQRKAVALQKIDWVRNSRL